MTKPYESLIQQYTGELARARRRFHLLGYAKLALVAAVLGALRLAWVRQWALPASCGAGLLLLTLVVLWVIHIRVHRQMHRCQAVLDCAGRYLDRIAGEWKDFGDQGGEFLSPDHPYGADLDIVGEGSLYQLLNVAHTVHGRRRFAADLLEPRYTAAEIGRRQQAVEELAADPAFAVLMECDTARAGEGDGVLALVEALGSPGQPIPPVVAGLLLWVPPLVTVAFLAVLVLGNPGLQVLGGLLCLTQGVFWAAGYPQTSRALAPALAAPHIFGHYAGAVERVCARSFAAPLLADLRGRLDDATAAMGALDSIVGSARLKHSGLPYFLANIFLLWDYRCVVRLERWKQRHGARCGEWFEALGELEALLGLSVLGNVCTDTCLPQLAAQPGTLRAAALGHPLLPNRARVCNDLEMQDQLLIVSGSNMSGKTTFLRTVGVNLVLARAGGRVCAAAMETSLFRLRSSLRVSDDLGEGVSTFYAELRQVAAIIRDARDHGDLFFLIDELFRGTNSEDRLFGARAVIEELAGLPAVGLITTHDLSLCDLEALNPGIRNYSFSEHYQGDEMRFSYKMQPGKARTTNARFLMKQVGILRETQ